MMILTKCDQILSTISNGVLQFSEEMSNFISTVLISRHFGKTSNNSSKRAFLYDGSHSFYNPQRLTASLLFILTSRELNWPMQIYAVCHSMPAYRSLHPPGRESLIQTNTEIPFYDNMRRISSRVNSHICQKYPQAFTHIAYNNRNCAHKMDNCHQFHIIQSATDTSQCATNTTSWCNVPLLLGASSSKLRS